MEMLCSHGLFTKQNEGHCRYVAYTYVLQRNICKIHIYSVTHEKHKEYIYEGLPAGKTVGIVEAVPYEVQGIYRKAYKEYKKQRAVYGLLLYADPLCENIYYKEHNDSHTTVYIGPVIKPLLRFDIYHMSCKHVYYGKVSGNGLRKIHRST